MYNAKYMYGTRLRNRRRDPWEDFGMLVCFSAEAMQEKESKRQGTRGMAKEAEGQGQHTSCKPGCLAVVVAQTWPNVFFFYINVV